uniref:Uncharacterized protein n=1 Tax=Chromera velia CCMP2878 TaxID=1169474 RepID=A0A0G4GFF9_9ALVE|eukprot:Cvel_21658.t1-p1 / transcript=Cvel_21658.t1 / gene=Cvel_21658 / organism=Chromera_velia_CCMP2878 / gene_product=Ankyrin repeat domain-containing protein 29, putative / transcript_product=Ankyrin repeat domain-containing protein 29, putative / location=Cvel_scaffold2049:11898-14224(-) / protein_length=438 / sequence_SO=supercontig / SO=protein_coding / is_pseudo=false
MEVVFASLYTHVYLSQTLPNSIAQLERLQPSLRYSSYTYSRPPSLSGWCYFECAVTCFKHLLQLETDRTDFCNGEPLTALELKDPNSPFPPRIPLLPQAFEEKLDEKEFTDETDKALLKSMYRNFVRRSVPKLLSFTNRTWASWKAEKEMGAQGGELLADLVEWVVSDPDLRPQFQPEFLWFEGTGLVYPHRWRHKPDYSWNDLRWDEARLLASTMERLLCAFGKLRSVTRLQIPPFAIGRRGESTGPQRTYLEGLRRGIRGLFQGDGPMPASSNFFLLASTGATEVLSRLLDSDTEIDVNAKYDVEGDPFSGWTALFFAADCGHADTVKLLLERGADVDFAMDDGWTALMLASQRDSKETVRELLEGGADVNKQTKDGDTALHLAAGKEYLEEVVRLLLGANANTSLQDKYGRTARQVATYQCEKLIEAHQEAVQKA